MPIVPTQTSLPTSAPSPTFDSFSKRSGPTASTSASSTSTGAVPKTPQGPVPLREKMCVQCGQSIAKSEYGCIETPHGAAFHLEHFYCLQCHLPLADKAYCFNREGKVYCERHYIDACKPECDVCQKPILFTGIPLTQRILTNASDHPSKGNAVASAMCGAFLDGLSGVTLTVLDYHPRCLRCSNIKCKNMYLPGWQAVKLGAQYHCEPDALEAQQPKCFFCKFYIHPNDRYIAYLSASLQILSMFISFQFIFKHNRSFIFWRCGMSLESC